MWTRTSWRTNRYESLDEIRIHGSPVICLCSARSQLSRCHIDGLFYLLSTHRKSYDTVERLHAKFVRQDSILCPSSNQRWEDFIRSHRHFYLHIVLIRDGRKVRTIVRSRLDEFQPLLELSTLHHILTVFEGDEDWWFHSAWLSFIAS